MLLNTLVQTKLAATTRKRHTTRNEILGVFNNRNVQLAFYDTPGYVRSVDARKKDVKTLRDLTRSSAAKADVVLLVVDATNDVQSLIFQDTFSELVKLSLDSAASEIILILNKVDLVVPKTRLLEVTYSLVSLINGVKLGPDGAEQAQLDTTTFMISALRDDGVIDLKNYLISISKVKPWIIPKQAIPQKNDKDNNEKNVADDVIKLANVTNLTIEERVEELLLEAMMEATHEEIPYIADIHCKSIKKLSDNKIRIDVDIKVDTRQQQRIVIGQQGRTLLKIRSISCEMLEPLFKKTVILYLWIGLRVDDKSVFLHSHTTS